jgi:signal peptidase
MTGRIGRWLRRLAGVVTRCLLILSMAVGAGSLAILVLERHAGYNTAVILSGSMRPGMPVGTLVVSAPAPAADIRAGDVITFHPPGVAVTVTHRVIAVLPAPSAGTPPTLVTKGDANPGPDPWRVAAIGVIQRMRVHVPELGYTAIALQTHAVRFALVVVPALAFGALLLFELWRDDPEDEDGDEAGLPAVTGALPA